MKKIILFLIILAVIAFFALAVGKFVFDLDFADLKSFFAGVTANNVEEKEKDALPQKPSPTPEESPKDNSKFISLSYIAYGDSITFGADFTKGYARMDDPYPELVANELELYSYLNYGYSGATLATNNLGLGCISNQILSYAGQNDIISLMGGVNDYNRSIPLGTINDTANNTVYGALNVIAEALTTRNPDAFIFFMTPYKVTVGGKDYLTPNAQGYNLSDVAKAVKEVADIYDIPVLDMYNLGNFELEMYNADSDGIHPSQEFIKEYTTPQIVEFIKQHYK